MAEVGHLKPIPSIPVDAVGTRLPPGLHSETREYLGQDPSHDVMNATVVN